MQGSTAHKKDRKMIKLIPKAKQYVIELRFNAQVFNHYLTLLPPELAPEQTCFEGATRINDLKTGGRWDWTMLHMAAQRFDTEEKALKHMYLCPQVENWNDKIMRIAIVAYPHPGIIDNATKLLEACEIAALKIQDQSVKAGLFNAIAACQNRY